MNDTPKPSELLDRISLPKQDVTRLSFCGTSKATGVRKWVDSLLATQIKHTSAQLYKALPEVCHLKTDYQNRLEILETLRPSVQYCILGLKKDFLNQSLILPQEAQKAAIVAQSLQKNMIDGYLVSLIHITQQAKANKQTLDLLAKAIHRTITGIGLFFFRSFQLYTQPPPRFWSILHTLYLVAKYYEISELPIVDPSLKHSRALSISAAYLRVLMLSTVRPNQLSQTNIEATYDVFEMWYSAVKIHNDPTDDCENFYIVDLLDNKAPFYKSQLKAGSSLQLIELDFKQLLSQLSKQSSPSEEALDSACNIRVPKEFPSSLLTHLLDVWGNVAQRRQERKNIEGAADISIGLVDCHYFVCNGQEFDYFVRSSGKPDTGGDESIIATGLTPLESRQTAQSNYDRPTYRATLQNASAGGFCLLWRGDVPAKIGAGELIGIKEIGKRTWSVGVVRWIRQLKQASQLGIQVISTNPRPYGVAQNYDMGGYSDYLRTLYIPPSKFGNESATLLTSTAPFHEFNKVRIIDGDREWKAKLNRIVFSTTSVLQFSFSPLENTQPGSKNPRRTGGSNESKRNDFNSSWDDS